MSALLGSLEVEQTHHLVDTSAGEIGAAFNADRLVCDLSDASSLVQRLGRVDRLGTRIDDPSRVDLIAF